jgi:hypothetical protein
VFKDEIEEDGAHSNVRQQLLQEQDDVKGASETAAEKEVEDDQGTPEEQEKAVEKEAVPKGAEVDKEMGVKEESVEQQIRKELKEISIAVAKQKKFVPRLRG